jgi:ubiquitin-like protein Pup
MSQHRPSKKERRARAEEEKHPAGTGKLAEVETIDEILASVDEILEENESAVLRNYRQKGGE